jgi:hypothetical protein
VLVEVGEENFVDIALSETGAGPTGRFAGRITSEGIPLAGIDVKIRGAGEDIELKTDGLGEFETPEISTMESVNIEIAGQIPMSDGTLEQQELYDSWERPRADEVTRIDIDLTYQKIIVSVIDRNTRAPVPHAQIAIRQGRRRGRWRSSERTFSTGENGLANVLLPSAEEHELVITHPDYGRLTVMAGPDTSVSGRPSVVAELQPAVVCKGTVILPQSGVNSERVWIHVKGGVGGEGWTQVDADDQSFEFRSLMPGTYEVEMWGGSGMIQTQFELGPLGDDNVVLDFANPVVR